MENFPEVAAHVCRGGETDVKVQESFTGNEVCLVCSSTLGENDLQRVQTYAYS